MYAKQTIRERILKNKGLLNRLWVLFVTSFTTTWIFTGKVFAAAMSPADEINLIVERVISIMTQVGSAVLLLFIVKDAFTLLERKDDPMVRTTLIRDVFFLVVAAIFLFNLSSPPFLEQVLCG